MLDLIVGCTWTLHEFATGNWLRGRFNLGFKCLYVFASAANYLSLFAHLRITGCRPNHKTKHLIIDHSTSAQIKPVPTHFAATRICLLHIFAQTLSEHVVMQLFHKIIWTRFWPWFPLQFYFSFSINLLVLDYKCCFTFWDLTFLLQYNLKLVI